MLRLHFWIDSILFHHKWQLEYAILYTLMMILLSAGMPLGNSLQYEKASIRMDVCFIWLLSVNSKLEKVSFCFGCIIDELDGLIQYYPLLFFLSNHHEQISTHLVED